jgi:hypothetical protein
MSRLMLSGFVVGAVMALSVASALAEKPDWAGGGRTGHGSHDAGERQGHGRSNEHRGKPEHGKPENDGLGRRAGREGRFAPDEVVVVRRYFDDYPAHPAALPPGIAKKLARGKPLPPGIAKQLAPIELRQRIPLCMSGWECVLAGTDLLILDAVHGTIRDVLRGVVR